VLVTLFLPRGIAGLLPGRKQRAGIPDSDVEPAPVKLAEKVAGGKD